jgi:hypothetical protein
MRFSTAPLGMVMLGASLAVAFGAGLTGAAPPAVTVQATTMTDAQIQQKLQAEGCTNIEIKKQDKGHVDVTASKNGKTEKLAVNPQTGTLPQETDNDDD